MTSANASADRRSSPEIQGGARRAAVLTAIILAFIVLGSVAKWTDQRFSVQLFDIFDHAGVFVLAFLVAGMTLRRPLESVVAVPAAWGMVGAYYLTGQLVDGSGYLEKFIVWSIAGSVAAPLLLLTGWHLRRRAHTWPWPISIGFFAYEASYLTFSAAGDFVWAITVDLAAISALYLISGRPTLGRFSALCGIAICAGWLAAETELPQKLLGYLLAIYY